MLFVTIGTVMSLSLSDNAALQTILLQSILHKHSKLGQMFDILISSSKTLTVVCVIPDVDVEK